MASTSSSASSYTDLSLCVYIGNTTSLDDAILLNYCSNFGTIMTLASRNEKFCDFHIVEFAHHEHLDHFLKINLHKINQTILDVKLYKHLLTTHDILNIDRKFYIGPIFNKHDIAIIVQFYQILDSTLHYYLTKEDYLLFEFANRQSVSTIFEKQTIPIRIEHRKFSIYKPLHPRELVNKIISMKNKHNQIYIHGITSDITDIMLIDYFHKRTPVIACQILSDNRSCAIMEFNDEQTVRKILDTPNVRVGGVNLFLSKTSRHLTSILSTVANHEKNDDDSQIQSTVISKPAILEFLRNSARTQNHSPVPIARTTDQEQSLLFVHPTPFVNIVESLFVSASTNNESGWTSPPRTIISQYSSIDQLSSNPCIPTTNNMNMNSTTTDLDIKPIRKIPTNHILHFLEKTQNELDQIKDEYRLKFAEDRTYIEREINLLINEERQTLAGLNQYLNDHRQRVKKHGDHKRKKSRSSSTD